MQIFRPRNGRRSVLAKHGDMAVPIRGVSIVLTSFNYGHFIGRTLTSACEQRADDLEIVVVDNASTDDSWEVIQAWASRDARIRAYRNAENIGMIGNHVRGLELATKDRVLFLSADDYLLPGHVARLLAAHAQHPEIDYFFSSYAHVDEHDRFLRALGHIGHLRGSYFGCRNEFAELLTYDCYTCTPTTLFDREEMLAHGGFDPNVICGDYEAYLRLAGSGARFGFIDTVGVAVRIHAAEITGKEKYVATGKQLLDHLYILERYLTPGYEHLVQGHETRIGRLLQAKINNALQFPVGSEVVANERSRIEALIGRLTNLVTRTRATPQTPNPRVSVILVAAEDVNAIANARKQLEAQTVRNAELVLVGNANYDNMPLLLDRAGPSTPAIDYRAPQSYAVALNDALRVASGDIVTYLSAGTIWPPDHLERLMRAFNDQRVDALCVPVDLAIERNGSVVAPLPHFFGDLVAERAARIGEAAPLASLAHRRRLLDTTGLFDERLSHLVEFEFLQRVLDCTPLGVLDAGNIVLHVPASQLHPAIADPNGYLTALRAIYGAHSVDGATANLREQHLRALTVELQELAASPTFSRARAFDAFTRGAAPRVAPRRRPRILVIDDRVPYNELGRGYPRARSILTSLRDAGYEVLFYPLGTPYDEPPLTSGVEGVNILYGRGRDLLGITIDTLSSEIDLLWVSRPHNMKDVHEALRHRGSTIPIVYDAEAVYIERERIRAEVAGTPLNPEQYRAKVQEELAITSKCSMICAVSEGERALIATQFHGPIELLSFSLEARPTTADFAERHGLLFVGAIEADSPNDDALTWFVEAVWPRLPGVSVTHAGVMRSARLAGSGVTFLGLVDDLRPIYDRARIFIAPTRFSAGLPQKVYEAAASGVPIVATSLLARQLEWEADVDMLVADTPEAFADAIMRLNNDRTLWYALRERALARVRNEVSPKYFSSRVRHIVQRALSAESTQNT